MIRKFIKKILRRIILGSSRSEIEMMAERIETYRQLGAKIGRNVRLIGRIDGLNPHLVTIGDNCVIGASSALLTHCAIHGAHPVVIEDEVWIGFNALILPGVTVHTRSIVGAGAVVTRDVPPETIVVGNPARVLRSLTDEEVERISRELREFASIGKDPDGPQSQENADEP